MSLILSGSDGVSDIDGTVSTPAIRGTDSNTGIFFPAADTIAFTEGGAEAMRINSSGQVLVGTVSGTGAMQITGASGSRALTLNAPTNGPSLTFEAGGTAFADLGSSTSIFGTGSATDFVLVTRSGYPLIFGTSNAERMRIDTSGNLLVGTTSASRTSGAGVKIIPGATPTNYIVGASSVNNDSALDVYSTGAAAYRFQIGYGGTIYATSTTITGISDQRLKENIVDLDDGLDAVMALKPRKFDWKFNKGKNIKGDRGFIAQEFETVFPDMIEESNDPVPEGEEPYKAVNANLIPVLVKAIQELKAELDSVKAELQTLKGN